MNRRAALAAAATLAVVPRALAAAAPQARELVAPAVFEQTFWAVCDYALRSGALRDDDVRIFERLRGRGDEHATAIETVLERAGVEPPPRPLDENQVALPGFAGADRRSHYLRFAAVTAVGAVGAWYGALQQLTDPALLRLAAGALAGDAQSVYVLRELEGRERLPLPFELGRPE